MNKRVIIEITFSLIILNLVWNVCALFVGKKELSEFKRQTMTLIKFTSMHTWYQPSLKPHLTLVCLHRGSSYKPQPTTILYICTAQNQNPIYQLHHQGGSHSKCTVAIIKNKIDYQWITLYSRKINKRTNQSVNMSN